MKKLIQTLNMFSQIIYQYFYINYTVHSLHTWKIFLLAIGSKSRIGSIVGLVKVSAINQTVSKCWVFWCSSEDIYCDIWNTTIIYGYSNFTMDNKGYDSQLVDISNIQLENKECNQASANNLNLNVKTQVKTKKSFGRKLRKFLGISLTVFLLFLVTVIILVSQKGMFCWFLWLNSKLFEKFNSLSRILTPAMVQL